MVHMHLGFPSVAAVVTKEEFIRTAFLVCLMSIGFDRSSRRQTGTDRRLAVHEARCGAGRGAVSNTQNGK